MSYHWCDNVHTTAFTPRDFQVELLAATFDKNVMICIDHKSSKDFIALKIIQELAHGLRKKSSRKWTFYLAEDHSSAESAFNLIHHLTDLKVHQTPKNFEEYGAEENFGNFQVVVTTYSDFVRLMEMNEISWDEINLLVIEECHVRQIHTLLSKIVPKKTNTYSKGPKILGLAGPLYNAQVGTAHLSAILEVIENDICCTAETASDIATVLRYCLKPSEHVIQCAPPTRDELVRYLEELIATNIGFLNQHRFDPSEIYSDEFLDEIKAIPDPKKEPLQFLNIYLDVLLEMGPWCADRAAQNLLTQIEKHKVKTPHERHFILLCLISTTLIQIRAVCDYTFQQLYTEKERIEKYSSPKILRLFEVLRLFKPEEIKVENNCSKKFNQDIDCLDFQKLQIELEKTYQIVESEERKEVDEVMENLGSILHETVGTTKRVNEINDKMVSGQREMCDGVMKTKRGGNTRQKKRHYIQGGRHKHQAYSNDSDALYGIIFCDKKTTAKVLFDLLCEMSRNDPDLNFLNVQYTVDRVADPITEPKEAELEHRRQEEVLKRFRMHECNLLIGTPVLEEGIDLPKCNLVVRWDQPTTYRSYVQCKGRARAPKALHVILVGPKLQPNSPQGLDEITNESHAFACDIEKGLNKVMPKIEEKQSTDEYGEYEDVDDLLRVDAKCKAINNGSHSPRKEYEKSIREMEEATSLMIQNLAEYKEIEKILLSKCANSEPPEADHAEADLYTNCIKPYKPNPEMLTGASVDLGNAIALVNKYCAKLPSDTFTKLTPLYRCAKTRRNGQDLYQCTIRLPINSPLKYDIQGLPMPTKVLARRIAALIACRELHKCGELDNNLQPIGKEGFKASEPDWEDFELEKLDEQIVSENLEPRPGTTKRRQYYYKRIASEFSNCRPGVGQEAYLYIINMTLKCPIPEEQNTRGRKIYPPEEAVQGFGILTLKKIPKVSAFPIFTRSGEVKVAIELSKHRIQLNADEVESINTFLNYTFTNVLRLQKFLMLFDAEATENCVYIVPTIKTKDDIIIDWDFLQVICNNAEKMPRPVPEEVRETTEFDPNKFKDAVVMPWYRNQDQPQYFYVAEICYHLSPESCFPGENYSTFQEYYFLKYGITIQNRKQPLLDVDHTSARLNFLTPRYVNRKGVALPTSSEETKRAKRENLEQKQILVPELCTIHPFPASLWRAAVCLPCILYRINGLLLADEIRKQVSSDIAVGQNEIDDENFEWAMLDFGWSLAEVLKKSREAKQLCVKPEITDSKKDIRSLKGNDEDSGYKEDVKEQHEENSEHGKLELEVDKRNGKTANDLLEEVDEKLKSECLLEIGTWSNDMAMNIKDNNFEETDDWGILPPNVNLCSRNNTKIRYGSPTSWDADGSTTAQRQIESYFTDSDASFQSDDDYDVMSVGSDDDNQAGPLRIEFKSHNTAEAVETEEEIEKIQRQLAVIQNRNSTEKMYQIKKNLKTGFQFDTSFQDDNIINFDLNFKRAIKKHVENIEKSNMIVSWNKKIELPKKYGSDYIIFDNSSVRSLNLVGQIIGMDTNTPNATLNELLHKLNVVSTNLSLDDFYILNKYYVKENGPDKYVIEGCGGLFDNFNDQGSLIIEGDTKQIYIDYENTVPLSENDMHNSLERINNQLEAEGFSFDHQPDLVGHPGPSPSIILQALTMSNANDGINLERLETIGDSFLKYAITTYLYCKYEEVHEGKLSHLRSKQVSNLNLYRLGRRKVLGECMIATKFEPHDNWLPPCYYVPKELEKALIEAKIPPSHWNLADLPNLKHLSSDKICELVKSKAEALGFLDDEETDAMPVAVKNDTEINDNFPCFIPYNLVTQHSIPDKSIADCVEALIGAYLIECGPRGALLFMAWLGIRVLPMRRAPYDPSLPRVPGSTKPVDDHSEIIIYGSWTPPKSPLLTFAPNAKQQLELLLDGFSEFEESLGYHFRDRSYLLQAMTHASYSPNRLTDCYQRLEFLGDAVLDYLITRHLYEDPRQHSPGALTDLRSALVNNTIFASLAVRHGFHKYFRHLSPGLNEVIDRFVRIQHENGHSISEEYYLLSEEECDDAEDVEVPKALGDVFESVAGAIFLDSNMSLDMVWKVYSNMMKPEIEQFSNSVPKSPIRELLELEPETAKFGKPEKLADGRRVRVTVEVFGKGSFRGIGRNYRIAKCTAAKCALRQLKKQGLITKKH